jgi:hypothetical protein
LTTAQLKLTIIGGTDPTIPSQTDTIQSLEGRLTSTQSLRLRAGEWVEVRRLDEIARTLDGNGCLDGLPFMPEMVQYCEKRFRVQKSAHKTCDTIERYVIRRMRDAVHLEGLRCDGEAHGGCQAQCLLFWKEAWLKRSHGPTAHDPDAAVRAGKAGAAIDAAASPAGDILRRGARAPADPETGEERYRCQATELLRATTEVTRREQWDPRFYLRDVTSGNVTPGAFIRYGLLAMVNAFMVRYFGRRYPRICGLAGKQTPTAALNLRPGELVQVRSKDEIMQTLNADLKNRGLRFDVEMLPHCGSEKRVLRRVDRIVDERTGRLLRFTQGSVILDGVVCSGNLSTNRMFCPRAVYPYWREIWLQRADQPLPDGSPESRTRESD